MATRLGMGALGRALALSIVVALAFGAMPLVAVGGVDSSISGRVVDAKTNLPIAGATVDLYDLESLSLLASQVTTAAGTFLFDGLLVGEYGFEITAAGYDGYFDTVTLAAGEQFAYGDAKLDKPTPSVTGKVTGPTNAAIKGASVDAYLYDPVSKDWFMEDFAESAADGTWGMPLSAGTYRFAFSAEGFRSEFYNNKASLGTANNVTISNDTIKTGVNAQLAAAVKSIAGTVTDGSLNPLSDIAVDVYKLNGAERAYYDSAWTAVDGTYVLHDLPAGTYYAVSGGPENPDENGDVWKLQAFDGKDTLAAADGILLGSNTATTGVDFELLPADRSISGVVRDAGTTDLLSGVPVLLYSMDATNSGDSTQGALTDENGEFVFHELPAGDYRVGHPDWLPVYGLDWDAMWFGPDYFDGQSDFSLADTITVPPATEVTGIDLDLPAATPSVTGTVVATGTAEPLEGVGVSAFVLEDGEWWEVSTAITDASGAYEMFGLGDVECVVGTWGGEIESTSTIFAPRFFDGATGPSNADTVTASTGSTRGGVDLVLAPASPRITGKLVEKSGAPIADGIIVAEKLKTDPDTGEKYWSEVGFGFSASNGTFSVYPSDPAEGMSGQVRIWFDGGPDYFLEYYNNQRLESKATLVNLPASTPLALGNVVLDPYVAASTRISSDTRYSTATGIAKRFTDDWRNVKHVIIASGEDRAAADPLAAAGLVWAYNGAPVMLISSTDVPSTVETALKEIVQANGNVTIHIVGGKVSVPDARITEIKKALGANASKLSFTRIDGKNRYDNAKKIAERMKQVRPDTPDVALIANGADATKFFDALSLSAVTARTGAPILLVSYSAVPNETKAALSSYGVSGSGIWVAGGTKTVSTAVVKALGASESRRVAGATRYSTAIAVSETAIEKGWLQPTACGVAAKLPDALTGGAAIGHRGGSLLLTTSDKLQSETADYLDFLGPDLVGFGSMSAECYVFGGPKSVTSKVMAQIDAILSQY